MNRLALALAEVCRERLLAEKWLVAPTLRIGRQWLDAVTRSGQPVVNVRPTTLLSLAIDQAAADMTSHGLTFLPTSGGEMLVERVLAAQRKLGLEYLGQLEPSAGLSRAVYQAIQSVQLAGLTADDLAAGCFEVAEKGRDLRRILRDYQSQLAAGKWIDYPGVLELATARVAAGRTTYPPGSVLLLPEGVGEHELERRFLAAFPAETRVALPVDEPVAHDTPEPTVATSDLESLRWIHFPHQAPAPRGDDTARITRAVGEVNEVRGVLRSCIAQGIPWDEVELLHTDAGAYVPLVFEVLSSLTADNAQENLDALPPVTFAEGIPVRYSRPGRALALWVAWIRDDFPQDTLLKMLREGLLEIPASPSGEAPSLSRLARLLRRAGIGFGRGRYLPHLNERMKQIEHKLDQPQQSDDEGEGVDTDHRPGLERHLADLRVLHQLCHRLLDLAPHLTAAPRDVLSAARQFLHGTARKVTQLDQFARWRLVEQIEDLDRWLPQETADTSIDVWKWLAVLPGESRVLGSGPRPGSLHVAHLLGGGHSGRPHTFIVGLDDARFPGGGLEDPLLLDQERAKLSPVLRTGAMAMEERSREMGRLLARLRGRVTLSFASESVTADREMFPSPVVISAYRILSGQHDGEPSGLGRWLSRQAPPHAFAPHHPQEALGEAEWWIGRLCGDDQVVARRALVEARFPHLAAGRRAVESRLSSDLTEFDGLVPAAGIALDPTRELSPGVGEHVMSAHRLTTIGRCPLAFFFQRGLKIELPEPVSIDLNVWLDSATFGLLLHELFEQFLRELVARDETPDFARDRPRLLELLNQHIEIYRGNIPPPRPSAFRKQCEMLRETAETFLREEQAYCEAQHARPIYLEASLGMESGDEHQTPLDSATPLPVVLPSGKAIWVRGRVDRIDELPALGGVRTFAIWDYKTGSTWGYDQANPFRQGRMLQPYLYVTLVAHRLREALGPSTRVGQFGFFFPARRAAGDRIYWTPGELKDGGRIIELLSQVVAGGAFLATDNHEADCTFCDFRGICGDVKALSAASRAKLSTGHPQLAPHRELRLR